MTSPLRSKVTRRTLVAGSGLAIAAGPATSATRPAIAGPSGAARRSFPMLQGGLSGTITVGYADELGAKPKYVEQAKAAVEEANPDATVEIDLRQVAGGDYTTQLLLALDSGEGPDVIHIGGDRIGALADAGYIEPLDAYVAEWTDWESQYPEAVKGGVTYGDSVWAIPYGLDTRFLYFRRDIFEQVGLGRDWEPANIAGILEAATAIKDAGLEDVLPYALYAGTAGEGGTTAHGFAPVLFGYGGAMQDEAGKWIGASPAIDKALAYYERAWQTAEVVPAEILTTAQPWKPMREGMGSGRVALLFEGGWVYGGYQTAAAAGDIELDNIGYLLFPTEDGGPSLTIGGPGTVWYINAASQNKDLAWEFIKAFNTPEITAALNLEDPHPVARTDAAALPDFQANAYLVAATESLESAVFLPNDARLNDVGGVVQSVTGAVAAGDATAAEASADFLEAMQRELGEENVVSVTA